MNTNTQANEILEEFELVFTGLDDSARKAAISILRTLEYAQSLALTDVSKLKMGAVAV